MYRRSFLYSPVQLAAMTPYQQGLMARRFGCRSTTLCGYAYREWNRGYWDAHRHDFDC